MVNQRQILDTNACVVARMQGMKHNMLLTVDLFEAKFDIKMNGYRTILNEGGGQCFKTKEGKGHDDKVL